jgi:hypothetical protein
MEGAGIIVCSLYFFDSSEKFVGGWGLRELAK